MAPCVLLSPFVVGQALLLLAPFSSVKEIAGGIVGDTLANVFNLNHWNNLVSERRVALRCGASVLEHDTPHSSPESDYPTIFTASVLFCDSPLVPDSNVDPSACFYEKNSFKHKDMEGPLWPINIIRF